MTAAAPQLDDLLYTLDLCADSLPFDYQAEHIRRLEEVKARLRAFEEFREKATRREPRFTLLDAADRFAPNDRTPERGRF